MVAYETARTFSDGRAPGCSPCVCPARGRTGLDMRALSDKCSIVLFRQEPKGWRRPGELKSRFTVKHPPKLNVHACFGHGGYGCLRLAKILTGIHGTAPGRGHRRALRRESIRFARGSVGFQTRSRAIPNICRRSLRKRGSNLGSPK